MLLQKVSFDQSTDSGGRNMGVSTRNDGQTVNVLLEWRVSAPAGLEEILKKVLENIPTDEDVNRPEEIRSLKIEGIFDQAQRTAIVYQCPSQPVNLRDVLQKIPKPSADDRRVLASLVANQVRSLHVHYQFQHTALRTESLIFFHDNADKLDLANPHVLDWGLRSFPSIYQHPEYQIAKSSWFCDVWSLLMILSEIAEWQLIDGAFRDEPELVKKKLERKQRVMDPEWKGELAAAVFTYGFGFLEKDHNTLEQLSYREIRRFFDKLCALLERSAMEQH